MSRLNNLYQSVKRHTGKIVAGALIVGALAGVRGCAKNIGEEVYRGNIDGYSVVYEEDRFSFAKSSDFQKNRMTAQKGDMTYIFEDITSETNIDWRNQETPNFEKDNLERVVIKNGDSSKEYLNPWKDETNSIDTSTIQGQKAQEVFDKANPLYNNLRAKIRKDLRNNYDAGQKPFIDSFQK